MKTLTILCTMVALCVAQVALADEKDKDGKKVPPGLQKKDGVPPGQAKKNGQAEEAAPAPAAPAPTTTAAAPAPATAKPAVVSAKPATLAEHRATLDRYGDAVHQATRSNPTKHKLALQHIARETGMTLERLKEQDQNFPQARDTGLLLGNVIAKSAGAKFNNIMQARLNGKRWDEIAKAHNVDFGVLVDKAAELAQVVGAK